MRCSGVSRFVFAVFAPLAPLAPFAACLAASSVACSTDSAGTGAPGTDASTDATADTAPPVANDASADGAPGASAARVNDVGVYLGQTASLAVTVTPSPASATYAWELTQAAAGSALTTGSLGATDGPELHFVPDVRGDFALKITVTAGGASTSASAVAHADAAPVFYTRATFDANGGEVAVHVTGTDGSGEHAVACAITFNSTESSAYRFNTLFAAATTTDAWEAPPGQPSRFVFAGTSSTTKDDAGAFPTFLIAGTTSNSCTSVPTTLRSLQAPAGALGQPRFSPDGSRIAFVDPIGASFGVSTIAFDGSAYRSLAPIYAAPPPANGDESANIRPEWRDASHVAWARPQSGAWDLMIASDSASPAASVLMTCASGSTPHHVAFAGDSLVLASYAPSVNAPTDIFVLQPGASAACTVVRNLTKLTGAASRAHDFALSPDGKWVAYLHYDAAKPVGDAGLGNDGDLYVVPVDGSKPPAPLGASPLLGRIGPRWIAGGTAVAFTRAADADAPDGGDARLAGKVTVLSAEGGAPRDLAGGNGVDTVTGAFGPGGSCALARRAGRSPLGPVALASVLALLLITRRLARRRAAQSRLRSPLQKA